MIMINITLLRVRGASPWSSCTTSMTGLKVDSDTVLLGDTPGQSVLDPIYAPAISDPISRETCDQTARAARPARVRKKTAWLFFSQGVNQTR